MENISMIKTAGIEQNNKKSDAKGSLAAIAASQGIALAAVPPSLLAIKGLTNSAKGLDSFQKENIKTAAKNVLDTTGLTQKGVKLNDFKNAGLDFSTMPDKLKEMLNPIYATAKGKNAFFGGLNGTKMVGGGRMFKNEVVCNMDKLPTAIFHEIGHAYNANSSKFWKAVQGMRGPAMVIGAGLALFCALTKSSKPSDNANGELTGAQKAKNFVRENSGKLAFLSMVPVLAEEGMATIRGNAWAKQMLSPDIAKKVSKGNKIAYISYIAAAAGVAAEAHFATKIKDNFTDKKDNDNSKNVIMYSHQG